MLDLSSVMSTQQVADILGIHKDSVSRLIRWGKLRAIKPGGHDWLVTQESLQEYLKRKEQKESLSLKDQ